MAIDDNTTYGLTGAQVKELAGQVNSAKTQTGASAPTTATPADYVGQLFYDTTNDDLYCCSAITAQGTDPETYEYTWESVGGGGIPTNAKFWGRTYDSVNNVVRGIIVLGPQYNNGDFAYIGKTYGSNVVFSLSLSSSASAPNGGLKFHRGPQGPVTFKIGLNDSNYHISYLQLDMQNHRITSLADPTATQDAATKNYVDTQVGNIETILQTLNSGTGAA